jgi:dihydroorotate dehydrogenase (NAD+) catalytic subunit
VKAKRRVVTTGAPTKRRPTVRRIKPAIVPASRRSANGSGPRIETGSAEGATAAVDEVDPGPLVAVDLSVDLGRGLRLANPILVASGTFGYGVEYGDVVDVQRLGAICSRGTTLRARVGNPTPRVTETRGGMLNSIGLQNPGVDAVVEKYASTWAGWQVPVIVNIAGESIADYSEVARRLDGVPGIAGIELNLSCPNAGAGGLQFAIDAGAAGAVTAAVRRVTDLPLLVKLSPNVADARPIARAIADAGADALTAVNTVTGIAVAPDGGVTSLGDVLDYLAVGAVAVQVGTAVFADPTLPVRLVGELAAECRRRGLSSHAALVGSALPRRASPPSAKGVEYRP